MSTPLYLPDSYESLELRARMALAGGETQHALELYQKLSRRLSTLKPEVLQRRPELQNLYAISLVQQAMIQHRQGNFESAAQLCQQLLSVSPESARFAQRLLALVHIDMGRVEAGLDELRAQAVASPGDVDVWLVLADECQNLGRLDEAEEHLHRAARNASDASDQNRVYLALFDFYRAQGRVEDALAAWDQAWAAKGGEPDYIFPVYQMLWEAGNPEQAYAYLERERNPLRKGYHQGKFAAEQGRWDEADRHWQRVAKLDPHKYPEGHDVWAEAALRVNGSPQQVQALLLAVRQAGHATLHGVTLEAVCAARLGHLEVAAEILQMAVAIGWSAGPRRRVLPLAHWQLFEELIGDQAVSSQLRHYFEDDQPTAPDAEPAPPA